MTTRLTPQGATLLVLFVAISMKLSEPASLNGDCDFNSGTLCAWKQERLDDFDWLVRGGPTPDRDTGPNAGSDGGNYLFIESSDKNLGKKAVLKLEALNTIAGGPKCFSFKYFMFGRDIETLMVFQENRPIFTLSGPQGNRWMKATGRLFPAAQTKITIHGVVGIGPKGDIAIDEIEFLSNANCGQNVTCPAFEVPNAKNNCSETKAGYNCTIRCKNNYKLVGSPEDGVLPCLTMGTWSGNHPRCIAKNLPESFNCDFEYDMCGWPTDAKEWRRNRGPSLSDTGAKRDNTPGYDGRGFYLLASSLEVEPGTAVSITYSAPLYLTGCLEFFYIMRGSSVGQLSLLVDNGPVFSDTYRGNGGENDDDTAWKRVQGYVTFKMISFRVTFGDNKRGDIAIDDISLKQVNKSQCGLIEAKCPPIPSPFQGSSTCASPFKNPDEICKFECNEGFQLVGPERLRCLPFGTWNDKPPLCLNNPIKLRLAGLGPERPNAGRVEIQVGDTWGSICRDKWTQVNSELVCRTLGYKKPIATYIDVSTLKSPTGNLPIWLDNVVCDEGAQNPLEDCRHNGFGIHNCDVEGHSQDVAIECRNQTSPPITSVPATTESTKKVAFPLSAKIATGVGSLVLVLIIVLVVVCCIRRKKRRKSKDGENPQHVVVFSKDKEAETEDQEDKPSDPWEVNPKYITFMEELGQGAFGKVFKAIYQEPPPKEEQIIMAKLMGTPELIKNNRTKKMVAIKTLHETADSIEKQEFLKEINLMKKLGFHPNIVNFLFCCSKNEPNFLVVEFLPKGDLLRYLRTNRHRISGFEGKEIAPAYLHTKSLLGVPETRYVNPGFEASSEEIQQKAISKDEDVELTPKDLLSFSYQIAAGMVRWGIKT